MNVSELARRLAPGASAPRMIALAGPPGAGKSTVAERLAAAVPDATLVAQDGFHLDNALLDAMGARERKGAPHTFDVAGLAYALARIRDGEEVLVPVFDRSLDLARACAVRVPAGAPTVIVEGNYLLLDDQPWNALRPLFDATVMLAPPIDVLRERLVRRWLDHGLDKHAALARAEGNDLPNARLVLERSREADIRVAHLDL